MVNSEGLELVTFHGILARPMLRKCNPIWVAACILLTGCDFFSTRDILPKPSDIHSFQGLFNPGDSLFFRVTESLREAQNEADQQVLSKRILTFTFLGDSVVDGKRLKLIALKVLEQPSGIVIERSRRLLDYSGEGLILVSPDIDGSIRFFPFKSASNSNKADTTAYLALPVVFFQGWSASQSVGLLEINRRLASSTDTLSYLDHSEATWQVEEIVSDRGYPLVHGKYWYGASGLLKVEQTWPNFGWREANAANLAADLNAKSVDLHRTLERL
jgi:hypothetical protein